MRRIHLFEFEDQSWFPTIIRDCMTRMIDVVHRWMGTSDQLANILAKIIKESGENQIVDMCSGNGGPMPDALAKLESKHGLSDVELVLSDLYPNTSMTKLQNANTQDKISYLEHPVDVTQENKELKGIRTMICSFHHMTPENAQLILQSAQSSKQPFLAYEISDNSAPHFVAWIAFPINLIMSLIVSLFARPMTVQQLFFTFIIPIIPICYAWDGTISNMRTYTKDDMKELLENIDSPSNSYEWEIGELGDKMKKLYLIGKPKK